jgi:hypothetical protein
MSGESYVALSPTKGNTAMRTKETVWTAELLSHFGGRPNGSGQRTAEGERLGGRTLAHSIRSSTVAGGRPLSGSALTRPVMTAPSRSPARDLIVRDIKWARAIKTRPRWEIATAPALPILPFFPVPVISPPIPAGSFQLWAMPESNIAFFALTAPRRETFSISLRVEETAGTVKITGGEATLSVSTYPEGTAAEIEQNRQGWAEALATAGHGQRSWSFRPLLMNGLTASINLPPEYLRAPPTVATSSDLGNATFQILLSEVGALAFKSALEGDRIDSLNGTCTLNAKFLAQNGSTVVVRDQNLTSPLSILLAGVDPESLRIINPQMSVEAQVAVLGHSVLQSATINWVPSEGHQPESLTFDSSGGRFTGVITSGNLERVTIDWSAVVEYKPAGWPLIQLKGRHKIADSDWNLVIKPDSWVVTYSLMVLMTDAGGNVISSESRIDPEDRVQGEVRYSAPYLNGGTPLTTTFETSSQQAIQVAVPLPPGEKLGEVRLTLFALRGGKSSMEVRILKSDETFIVARISTSAKTIIKTNQDPVEESSDEGNTLTALATLVSADVTPEASRTGPTIGVVVDGDDIYLDPPVRLLPQYDGRWAYERIGGPRTGRMLDWITNGCNASTAAMILRWFAEDCTGGSIPFPTKPDSAIDPSWYPLRMAEAFWPEADPPGKVELTPEGRINFRKLYSVAAHYLKTGEIERREGGNVIDPSPPKAHYVTSRPAGGWMDLIRTMLEMGPVIVGIGAPAGHFVVAHGIMAGGLLIADPGAVLYQAHHGGRGEIEDWSSKEGYLDGTMDSEQVRMPSPSFWPDADAPGRELDGRSYHLISGEYLSSLLDRLISVTSLTYPDGVNFSNSDT